MQRNICLLPLVMRLSSTRPLPQYPPVVSRSPHVRILTKLTQNYPRLPSRFSPSANQQGKETAAAYRLLVLLAKVDRWVPTTTSCCPLEVRSSLAYSSLNKSSQSNFSHQSHFLYMSLGMRTMSTVLEVGTMPRRLRATTNTTLRTNTSYALPLL